ncbi:MAG: PIN domain-containing protein [Betaproteobacteria bacterium]|nr:PIN domain-containing protein [Betaproteobacteria bacterium]
MIYLDTSVLVPLIVPEAASVKARAWRASLGSQGEKELALSTWTITEFSSAIGLKVRNREITRGQGEAAIALLEETVLPHLSILEVTTTDFRLAESMLREFTLGLRAGDALHLAIASRRAVREIAALDHKLNKAAEALKMPTSRI